MWNEGRTKQKRRFLRVEGRSGLHELRFDGDVSGEYEGTHQGGNHETEGKVEKGVLIWKQKLNSFISLKM